MLRRQYDVIPQISIKNRVVWFEWPANLTINFATLSDHVEQSSLAIRGLHVIGSFTSDQGQIKVDGFVTSPPIMLADGQSADGSKKTYDLSNYLEQPVATLGEMITPVIYQP